MIGEGRQCEVAGDRVRHANEGWLRGSLRLVLVCLAWSCGVAVERTHAQFEHFDVNFRYDQLRVVTDRDLYTATFPRTGISKQYSSNPGFSSEKDQGGGVPAGNQIAYDVLGGLRYWNDGLIREPLPGTRIRIQNNPPAVPETWIGWDSGPQFGEFEPPRNRIGQSSSSGEVHAHVNFFLEPLEATEEITLPAAGAYGLKLSLRSSAAGIEPSLPFLVVFNHGLNAANFQRAIDAFRSTSWTNAAPGDLDGNGVLDAADIDLLSGAILAGETDSRFDLDANGIVAAGDRQFWVESLKRTYFGDANLDGGFDTGDLVAVFQRGQYEDLVAGNSRWSDGDWDGDREFSSADFIIAFQGGGFEQGPRAAVAVLVPEPTTAALALQACLLVHGLRRLKGRPDRSRGWSARSRGWKEKLS